MDNDAGSVGKNGIADKLQISRNNSVILDAFTEMDRAVADGRSSGEVMVGGKPVSWTLMPTPGRWTRKMGLVPRVSVAAIEIFREAIQRLPFPGVDDLSRKALTSILGAGQDNPVLAAAWSNIREAMQNGKTVGEVLVDGKSVPWRLMQPARGRPTPYVSSLSIETFLAALGHHPVSLIPNVDAFNGRSEFPPATSEHLTLIQILANLDVSVRHPAIATVWSTIQASLGRGKVDGNVPVGNEKVHWWLMRTEEGPSSPFFHADAVSVFHQVVGRQAVAASNSTVSELTQFALVQALNISYRHGVIQSAWIAMKAAVDRGEKDGTVLVGGKAVAWHLRRTPSGFAPCVSIAALQTFRSAIGSAPLAGSDSLTRSALVDVLGTHHLNTVIATAWSTMEAAVRGGETEGEVMVAGRSIPWRLMRTARGAVLPCVSPDTVELFRSVLDDLPVAGSDHLSRRKLVGALGTSSRNRVIVEAWSNMEAAVERGETSGEVYVGETIVPWRMMRGSRGGVVPHIPATSVEVFRSEIEEPSSRLSPRP